MKNLKRALSFALATVMLVGMMVVGVSAAEFTDAETITNNEAVDVMVALGVIKGKENGNFDPEGTLTRAEAAKIVTYMLLGPSKAELLGTTGVNFTDVAADHWAASYIGYCSNMGILSGYDGKFDPNGELTGLAFGKMMLVALGYDAKIEKYVGAEWGINVAVDMVEAGLDLGDDVVLANPISRDNACQMAFNTLTADMVKYANKGTEITLSDGTKVVIGATPAEVIANKTSSYVVGDSDYTTTGTLQFCEKYFADLEKDTDTDAFGRTTTVWSLNDKEVGAYTGSTADYTYVVSSTTVNTVAKAVEKINKKLEFVATPSIYVAGTSNSNKNTPVTVGDVLEVYLDSNNDVAKVVILSTYLAEITKVAKTTDKDADYTYTVSLKYFNNTTGTPVTLNDTKLDGFDADTMAKGDYVLYTPGKGEGIIANADVVTGTKTATGSGYIKVDGEKLNTSGNIQVDESSFTNTCDFYKDANGYVVGAVEVEEGETVLNYVYIADSKFSVGDDFTANKAQLSVVYMDGTKAVVNMATKETTNATTEGYYTGGTTKGDATNMAKGKLYVTIGSEKWQLCAKAGEDLEDNFYSFTADDDGNITKLTALDSKKAAQLVGTETVTVDKGVATVTGISNKYADGDTVLTVLDGGKSETVTGYKNFPENTSYVVGTSADAILYTYSDKTITGIYVLGGTIETESDAVIGYYVSTGDSYNKDGKDYTVVTYNVDGVNTEYTIEADSVASKLKGVVSITVDNKDIATLTPAGTKTAATIATDTYFVDGSTHYLADDVAIYDVTDTDAIVELDAVPVNAVIVYTTKTVNSKTVVDYVFVTVAAESDGVLAENDADYIQYVLGFGKDDAKGAEDNGWLVIQYNRDKACTGLTITIEPTFTGDNAKTTTFVLGNPSTTGVKGIMINLDEDYGYAGGSTGAGTAAPFAAGTYTYTITGTVNGSTYTYSVGSFEVK